MLQAGQAGYSAMRNVNAKALCIFMCYSRLLGMKVAFLDQMVNPGGIRESFIPLPHSGQHHIGLNLFMYWRDWGQTEGH